MAVFEDCECVARDTFACTAQNSDKTISSPHKSCGEFEKRSLKRFDSLGDKFSSKNNFMQTVERS